MYTFSLSLCVVIYHNAIIIYYNIFKIINIKKEGLKEIVKWFKEQKNYGKK